LGSFESLNFQLATLLCRALYIGLYFKQNVLKIIFFNKWTNDFLKITLLLYCSLFSAIILRLLVRLLTTRKIFKTRKHSDDPVFCPKCCEPNEQSCFDCDICRDSFHPHSTGLSTDCRKTLVSVVHECSWVCADCRIKHKDQISKLQTSLSRVIEALLIIFKIWH